MEEHSPNGINYVLSIEAKHADYLGQIRHWPNIKMANDDGLVWVKDFTRKQLDSIELKSIPYKELFELRDNKLFPMGSALPVKKLPSLLWTPIQRGLAVTLPKFNFNYFGVEGKVTANLVPSERQRQPFALMIDLDMLRQYMEQASAIRLKEHTWVILNDKALVLGTPLLPLKGETYWQQKGFLIPTGYELDMSFLLDALNDKLDPENSLWVLWQKEGAHIDIDKKNFKPLSLSSFRLTMAGKAEM